MVSQCWSSARQVHVPPIVQSTMHAVIALVSWNWWWENSEIQTSSICFKHLHSTYRFFNLIFSLDEHTSSSIEGVPAVWTPIVANSITSHKMSRPLFFFSLEASKFSYSIPYASEHWCLFCWFRAKEPALWTEHRLSLILEPKPAAELCVIIWVVLFVGVWSQKDPFIDYDIFWPGAVAFRRQVEKTRRGRWHNWSG